MNMEMRILMEEENLLSRIKDTTNSVDTFVLQLKTLAPELHERARSLQDLLAIPEVTVAFVGHFKAGKSSLINSVLGRDILPIDDLPETGAACVLQSGEQDNAYIMQANIKRAIECTMQSIRENVALRTPEGIINPSVYQIDRVEICLSGASIPAKVKWVDTPGINDIAEMDDRSYQAARTSDILIWVLGSRQFLSIAEQEFIGRYLAQRSPAEIIFVINAFLDENSLVAWHEFCSNRLPVHVNKLKECAPAMGFPEQAVPEFIAVSAQADHKDSDFGRDNIQQVLAEFDSEKHPRVQLSRLARVATGLEPIINELNDLLRQERCFLDFRKKQEQYTDAVEQVVNVFFIDWETLVVANSTNVKSKIKSRTLKRDATYEQLVNDGIQNAFDTAFNKLTDVIANLARKWEQPSVAYNSLLDCRSALTPPKVSIQVPKHSLNVVIILLFTIFGALLLGGLSSCFGILWPEFCIPIGLLLGGIIGFLIGRSIAVNRAANLDAQGVSNNISSAVENIKALTKNKQADMVAFFIRNTTTTNTQSLRQKEYSDETYVEELALAVQTAQKCQKQAAELAYELHWH